MLLSRDTSQAPEGTLALALWVRPGDTPASEFPKIK